MRRVEEEIAKSNFFVILSGSCKFIVHIIILFRYILKRGVHVYIVVTGSKIVYIEIITIV